MLRLVAAAAPGGKPAGAVGDRLARATGHGDFAALEADLKLAKATVLKAWEATFGTKRRGK
jgi:hypothetical protein